MADRAQTIELLERTAITAIELAEFLREMPEEEVDLPPAEPFDFLCPLCGAPPGQSCYTRHGGVTDPHQDRVALASGGGEPTPCACRAAGWKCYLHDPLRAYVARRQKWGQRA